jgi:VanZ family protein
MMNNLWLRWGAVLAWMGLIFFLSAQSRLPNLSPSLSDALQDIVGHFVGYAVLAALLHWALSGLGTRHATLLTLVIVLLYACSDEFHQSFVPGRHPDLFDIVTDLVGAAFALLAINLRRSRSRRR